MTEGVAVHVPEPGIGVIRLDRPERRNALNLDVKRSVTVIITGSDHVFIAGTDIAEMADMTPATHAKRPNQRHIRNPSQLSETADRGS